MMLAQQALTVQAASGGRLTLGIGLSHQMVIEHMYGYSFERPASFMEEYLTALGPLLRGEQADADTDRIRTHLRLDVADAAAPGLLVAALGSRMLRAAAELADGTVTWMTGPSTLAEHTIPTLRAAAGGQDKRVVAALPVAVTDDVAGAKARAAKAFEVYGILPSYRAMLDREGAAGPEDVALIGDAATVTDAIKGMVDSGVTEFVAVEFSGGDDARRTRDALASLL
jgi:F420-dependent oxidoreductase-like protein